MKILVTGNAGFIGFHLTSKLLKKGHQVIGIDNINDYYDVKLKKDRLNNLETQIKAKNNYKFFKTDLENLNKLEKIFTKYQPELVFHLAAQAGVRYSLIDPFSYVNSNLVGFLNILECCRKFKIKHLIYASSSSVYGGNELFPFKETNSVDHPVSLYAATKKSNELMAHCYSHLFKLPTTGLRFFTVYGPWGRPDMAAIKFAKNILNKKPINIFNNGEMLRDFTFVEDIVESLIKLIKKEPKENKDFKKTSPDPSSSWAPYRVFNIGNSNPIPLMEFISCLEKELGIKAIKNFLPMQPGDVKSTFADNTSLEKWINFKPRTSIDEGIKIFVKWYKEYY